jgi:hypothetical protein
VREPTTWQEAVDGLDEKEREALSLAIKPTGIDLMEAHFIGRDPDREDVLFLEHRPVPRERFLDPDPALPRLSNAWRVSRGELRAYLKGKR